MEAPSNSQSYVYNDKNKFRTQQMNSRRDSIQVQAIHVEQHLIETEKKPVEPEERN